MAFLLTRQDVEALLPMSEAMAAVELAFKEHALGNGVGSHAPKMSALDTTTIVRALLIADQKMVCLAEAGDIIIPIQERAITEADIHGELGQVITGQVTGRTSDEQITLFKSVGLAIQDVAAAARVYALAQENGVGQELPL